MLGRLRPTDEPMGLVAYWRADAAALADDNLVLLRLPCAAAAFTLAPNDEEVMDVAWVTSEELAGAPSKCSAFTSCVRGK